MGFFSGLFEWLRDTLRSLRPWVIVQPWEQGVMTWCGKRARLIGPGLHVKVPVMHEANIHPIRTRTVSAPLQTLRSADGRIVTIGIIVQHRITDLLKVLDTLHNPSGTIVHMAQGVVSEIVARTAAADLTPELIAREVKAALHPTALGLGDFGVMVSDNADLSHRTFRLLNSGRGTPGDDITYDLRQR